VVRRTLTATQIRERLADLATERPEVALVVLFGSTARNRAGRDSDLDIAVGCDGPADLDALYPAIVRRLHADRIDLVDLRRAGPVLAFEIARSGQVLLERQPGAFRAFQSLASRRYCDMAKLRRAQRRAIHVFHEREGLA
jgi:predicted nucleotidyltransferase